MESIDLWILVGNMLYSVENLEIISKENQQNIITPIPGLWHPTTWPCYHHLLKVMKFFLWRIPHQVSFHRLSSWLVAQKVLIIYIKIHWLHGTNLVSKFKLKNISYSLWKYKSTKLIILELWLSWRILWILNIRFLSYT